MTIESTIISFAVMCGLFIFSNIMLFPYRRARDRRLERMTVKLQKKFHALAKELDTADTRRVTHAEAQYTKWLRKKLRALLWLMGFDNTFQALLAEYEGRLDERYVALLLPCFEALCDVYEKKDVVSVTFFINVLGKLFSYKPQVSPRIREFLYVRLRSSSIECRQHAMDALCETGDIEMLSMGLSYLNKYHNDYNDKLITDGLLKFNGDRNVLCAKLWQLYPTFGNSFKLAIINFLRLESPHYRQEAFSILQDARADEELHYAAIRYLGKYPLPEAEKMLQQYVRDCAHETWIYAAVSATALAAYPGESSFRVLKQALFSPEWYVRLNASNSLEQQGISYRSLADVMNSTDRYAREIVRYRLEQQQMRLQENEA